MIPVAAMVPVLLPPGAVLNNEEVVWYVAVSRRPWSLKGAGALLISKIRIIYMYTREKREDVLLRLAPFLTRSTRSIPAAGPPSFVGMCVFGTDRRQRACLRGVILSEHARDMAGAAQHRQHSSG